MAKKSEKELADEAKQLETIKFMEADKERKEIAPEETPLTEELTKLSQTPPTTEKK